LIHINDINSAPICGQTAYQIYLDSLAEVGSEVQQLACYDTDVDPLNKELSYVIESGNTGKV